jgi:hypothetical protein
MTLQISTLFDRIPSIFPSPLHPARFPYLKWIPPLLFPLNIQSLLNLLLMPPIQILQQNLSIPLFSLVPTHIVAPATYCGCQATGDVGFVADGYDGVKVCADCEDDCTSTGEAVYVLEMVGRLEGVIWAYRRRLWRSLLNQWCWIALFFSACFDIVSTTN